MKKFHLLNIMFIFNTVFVLTQPDYRPGYIITVNNDSVKGYIRFNPKDINTQTLQFKRRYNEFNTFYSYPADSVKRFYIHNLGYFETMDLNTNFKNYGKVYAQVIYKGKLDMLFFNKKYILKAPDGTCMELRRINFIEKGTDLNVIRVSTPYIDFLKKHMTDCEKLNQEIDSLVLLNRTLRRFYRNYHHCIQWPYKSYLHGSVWNTIDLAIVAGLNTPVLKTSSSDPDFTALSEELWDYKPGLMAGFYTNLRIPGLYNKLMLHTGALYSQTSVSTYTVVDKPVYTLNTINIDFSTLKIPLGLVHRFTDSRISPFIDFGICANLELSESTALILKQPNRDPVSQEAFPLRNYQTGLFGGGGLMFKFASNLRLIMQGRYEKYGEIDEVTPQYSSFYTSLNNFSFLIGIHIDE